MEQPILSEDEIRQRMSDISRRMPQERDALKKAYETLAKREARTQLAIKFNEPSLMYKPETKAYLDRVKAEGIKMNVGDNEALANLELEAEKIAYDLAKFDCETSEKDYAKLQPQLTFYQSLLKLT